MLNFELFNWTNKPRILCIGAHPDDIEIGCGGTILRILRELPETQIHWVVLSGTPDRFSEAINSANLFLNEIDSKRIDIQNFRQSYFPFIGAEIKDYFEKLKEEFSPSLILTHTLNDAHQDHRLVSELTWNTYRDNLVLEYEIVKYDGDLTTPNFYVHIDEETVNRKISHICKFFKTQSKKQWFSEETFRSIMRIRGVESNSPSRYAEAFHCRKMVI